MGITSLFHLIVFTHHIMSFQSSEMSVVFTKNKGGNGREREGWLLSQEELLENQGWAPHCLPQALSSWPWVVEGDAMAVPGPWHLGFSFSAEGLAQEEPA